MRLTELNHVWPSWLNRVGLGARRYSYCFTDHSPTSLAHLLERLFQTVGIYFPLLLVKCLLVLLGYLTPSITLTVPKPSLEDPIQLLLSKSSSRGSMLIFVVEATIFLMIRPRSSPHAWCHRWRVTVVIILVPQGKGSDWREVLVCIRWGRKMAAITTILSPIRVKRCSRRELCYCVRYGGVLLATTITLVSRWVNRRDSRELLACIQYGGIMAAVTIIISLVPYRFKKRDGRELWICTRRVWTAGARWGVLDPRTGWR